MNWASLIWAAISLVGVIVSIRSLIDIATDKRALAGRNGALLLLVSTRQRRGWIRLGAFLVYLIVGLDTLSPIRFSGEGMLLLIGLYVGLIALVLMAFLEQVDRAMIRRLFP